METLVQFKTAILAKEKGFDEKCSKNFDIKGESSYFTDHSKYNGYNKNSKLHHIDNGCEDYDYPDILCTQPSQSVLAKWLREEHNISINIIANIEKYYYCVITDFKNQKQVDVKGKKDYTFKTFEDAMEEGLFESLKLFSVE